MTSYRSDREVMRPVAVTLDTRSFAAQMRTFFVRIPHSRWRASSSGAVRRSIRYRSHDPVTIEPLQRWKRLRRGEPEAILFWNRRVPRMPLRTALCRTPCSKGAAMTPKSSTSTANTKITVHSSKAKPYDESTSPPLMEIHITETFSGDIDGESLVRALQVQCSDHYASIVSMQRVRGTLAGRQGTFVLQGQEVVEHGKISATWFVVPGSGTGALAGLRGEGGFEGEFGRGSEGSLDYWFE